jgi:hypothetical protein
MINRKGQVAIFIILGIVIVAGVAAYFVLRNTISVSSSVPVEFQPIYNSFLACVQDKTQIGINVLESQGGYIYLPAFSPGSNYQPFSSDLLFLGNPIPYWYYVSGNNIDREQVPNETFMQDQLAKFIESKIKECDLSDYSSEINVFMGDPQSVNVQINPDSVKVDMQMSITFVKGNKTVTVKNHKATVNSELGNLYSSAKTVYDYERSSKFLENYTIDVLRNYAPVDGVDLTCSPKTWSASDIFQTLKSSITDNIMSIKTGSNRSNYFNLDLGIKGLKFLTNENWPNSYEVNPTQGDTMIANPIGNQQGLGILGFCYATYHFVYSIKYPVLATIQSGDEIFQFPMAVVVENNLPRGDSSSGEAIPSQDVPLCSQGTSEVAVSVYDANSNPVDANVSYECLGQTCNIGQTSSGVLDGNFPQCVNGYIVVSAPGYKTGRYLFSTTQSGNVNVLLSKIYTEKVDLQLDGRTYTGNAVITFTSSDGTPSTIVYPEQTDVNLSEGSYNVEVYIYQNSSIKLGATTSQQCVNVASGGVAGVLGSTQQQCFTVNVPEQIVSSALSGGGNGESYFTENQLSASRTLTINAPSLPAPTSLTQLQTNYALFETKNITMSLT